MFLQALPLVPPLVHFLMLSPMVDQYNLSSIRVIIAGGAPVISSSFDRVYERFAKRGIRPEFAIGYGLTETSTCRLKYSSSLADNELLFTSWTDHICSDVQNKREKGVCCDAATELGGSYCRRCRVRCYARPVR